MYAKIENGVIIKYPCNRREVLNSRPNVSWPRNTVLTSDLLAQMGYVEVLLTDPPEDSAKIHTLNPMPVFSKGAWRQKWSSRKKLPDELAAEKKALLKNVKIYSQTKEHGGFTYDGMTIKTDEDTQNKLNIIAAKAKEAIAEGAPFVIKWAGPKGEWHDLDAALVITMNDRVFAHVQACFTARHEVEMLVENDTITNLEKAVAKFDKILSEKLSLTFPK